MKQQGLTLPELLVVLIILAVTLSFALPSYSELWRRDQLRITTLDFYQAIQSARSYAISRNKRVTMENVGTWQGGWHIYEDTNNNGQQDGIEPTILESDGLADVEVIPNRNVTSYISFIGSGQARLLSSNSKGAHQMGAFKICHPNQLNMAFQLTLSRGGRVNMNKIDENPCRSN